MADMKAIPFLLCALVVSAACNKHDVPLGGACSVNEDCDQTALACVKPAGAAQGFCSTTCSIAPPGTTVQSNVSCERAGLTCQKHATPHPILQDAYCDRP